MSNSLLNKLFFLRSEQPVAHTGGTMFEKMNISDIAKALGVSKSTVSRAISGKGRIGKETQTKILQFIEDNHYRPNSIAKSFSESKTYNIGVVLPQDRHLIEIPFFTACLLGISQELSKHDYDALVITVSEHDISNLKRIVENNKVDGIILTRLVKNDAQIKYLNNRHIPYLVIGHPENQEVDLFIDSDNQQACYDMTHKVFNEGYRKSTLLLGNPDYIVNQHRRNGYCQAVNHFYSQANVIDNLIDNLDIDVAIEQILLSNTEVIFCGDDFICARVLNYLSHHQHDVERYKIVSYYNSQVLSNHYPNLDVVNFDILAAGETAGDAMIKKINGQPVKSALLNNYKCITTN